MTISKRNKALLVVFGLVVVIAIGIGIWAYAAGKLKSSAVVTGNYIEGQVACEGGCMWTAQTAVLATSGTDPTAVAHRQVSTSGYFRFDNVAKGLWTVWVDGPCNNTDNPSGFCDSDHQLVSFQSYNETKQVRFTVAPYSGRLTIEVNILCFPPGPGGSCQYKFVPVNGAKVILTAPDGHQNVTYTLSDGTAFKNSMLDMGSYTVAVYKPGYRTYNGRVTVTGCNWNHKIITLSK